MQHRLLEEEEKRVFQTNPSPAPVYTPRTTYLSQSFTVFPPPHINVINSFPSPTKLRMLAYTQATIKTVVMRSMMDHECLRMKCEYACLSASQIKDTIKAQEIQTETF